MKIPIHYSLKVARQIVNKIDIPRKASHNVLVESWSNGREQGLSIRLFGGMPDNWKRINVAQQRSSDKIIVLIGSSKEFETGSNQPGDNIWTLGSVIFDYNAQGQAAKYIRKFITENYKAEVAFRKKMEVEKKAE